MRSASKSPRHHQLAWHRRRALARPEPARKNASSADDRRHSFTFLAICTAVAVWRASAAFFSTSPIAPARGTRRRRRRCHTSCAMTHACRAGGACANATSVRSRKSGEARLPRRVPSARSGSATHRRRFEPRDGCRRKPAPTRRASTELERKPISGVQRRRRPDR